ncbi:MAG: hypothetical protein ACREXU_20775 [Gammaproteobacteria bacterium]
MTIPTEPTGSIPRPLGLIEAVATRDGTDPALDPLYEEAIRDTIERFEATGSPVITDGGQRKYHNFWTYCVHGLPNTAYQAARRIREQDGGTDMVLVAVTGWGPGGGSSPLQGSGFRSSHD